MLCAPDLRPENSLAAIRASRVPRIWAIVMSPMPRPSFDALMLPRIANHKTFLFRGRIVAEGRHLDLPWRRWPRISNSD